jgi:hypothetical protein
MGNVTSMAGGKLHTRDICPRGALTMFAGRTQGRSKLRGTSRAGRPHRFGPVRIIGSCPTCAGSVAQHARLPV